MNFFVLGRETIRKIQIKYVGIHRLLDLGILYYFRIVLRKDSFSDKENYTLKTWRGWKVDARFSQATCFQRIVLPLLLPFCNYTTFFFIILHTYEEIFGEFSTEFGQKTHIASRNRIIRPDTTKWKSWFSKNFWN